MFLKLSDGSVFKVTNTYEEPNNFFCSALTQSKRSNGEKNKLLKNYPFNFWITGNVVPLEYSISSLELVHFYSKSSFTHYV